MSKALITIVAVAVVVAAGWYFLSPGDAGSSAAGQSVAAPAAAPPTPAQLATMPQAQREAVRTRLMGEAAARPDTLVDEAMDMQPRPVLAATGSFAGADAAHNGSGTVSIYQLPDSSYVVRLENFRVTNGPALVVALAVHPDPRASADVARGYISVGNLKGNTGNQNYPVPVEFDVLSFGSVVVWCELFGVMFSAAPLKLL